MARIKYVVYFDVNREYRRDVGVQEDAGIISLMDLIESRIKSIAKDDCLAPGELRGIEIPEEEIIIEE